MISNYSTIKKNRFNILNFWIETNSCRTNYIVIDKGKNKYP